MAANAKCQNIQTAVLCCALRGIGLCFVGMGWEWGEVGGVG